MRFLEIDGLPRLSKIGLGTWQFGSAEWGYGQQYAQQEASRLVRRALELGVNLIDTAELYGFGRSERIVGRALAGRREEAFLATKLFPVLPAGPVVAQRARASARRLGVQRLDLYQVHQPNPLIRDRFTMPPLRRLQETGLLGEVGVSNYGLERWQRAEAALGRRVLSNQVRYHLVERGPERELVPYAERYGRVVIAYSPLAQGLLAGTYDADHRPRDRVRRFNPLFLPENLERARPLLEALRATATAHDASPAQVALAWTVRHPNVVAIPGASSVEQLESNVEAAELQLADDEAAALDDAADAFAPITGLSALPHLAREAVRS